MYIDHNDLTSPPPPRNRLLKSNDHRFPSKKSNLNKNFFKLVTI